MNKKLIISYILISLLALSFLKPIDNFSEEQLDNALTRSLTVFAIVRSLNGLISVVQGTEVYATPAGVGVNFAVGQIVDPMNDMLERFSWVMLMSSVSLGIQKIILELGQTQFVQALLGVSVVVALFILWIPRFWNKKVLNFMFKAFIVFTFFRFLVPLVILMSEGVYSFGLEDKYLEAKESLSYAEEDISQSIKQVNEIEKRTKKSEETKGLWEKSKDYINNLGESFSLKKYYDKLQNEVNKILKTLEKKFDDAINNMLLLIEVFILQSILLPLAFLWLFMKLYRQLIQINITDLIEEKTS